ncbi:MAG: GTPase HflX [Thermaerobacter sp.]|nr:GTPase HflX [Thermaerobacter sp.]
MERALLVYAGPLRGEDLNFYLEELRGLVHAAGADVAGEVVQAMTDPDPRTYIGRGKVQEAREDAEEFAATFAVAAHPLSSAQQRHLEEELHQPVVDRTALILDIFAQRAQSSEGKLQVELAQLAYWLPRLRRTAGSLSRLGGGIGTRGPGESKLETDRRRIRTRMSEIRGRLARVERQRAVSRAQRGEVPRIALVGYTNAGKSTLLHALTASGGGEDQLFATLDPTTRRMEVPGHQEVLVTDTVGFVQDLPTELVAAFRATLEETRLADALVHVVDASHPRWVDQERAVQETLEEIGADGQPALIVYNKIDRLPPAARLELPGITISAATGEGIEALRSAVTQLLASRRVRRAFLVPHARGDLLALILAHGEVLAQRSDGEGTTVEVEIERSWAGRIAALLARG